MLVGFSQDPIKQTYIVELPIEMFNEMCGLLQMKCADMPVFILCCLFSCLDQNHTPDHLIVSWLLEAEVQLNWLGKKMKFTGKYK